MEQFDTPVVLFFFKRTKKTLLVLERIAQVRPKKLYLISDGPRNEAEKYVVEECRRQLEAIIDWPCDVVKNYAEVNKGVFDRIGLGAQWVLRQESSAIFLEDDNLPELSFFPFCKEMLERYSDDTRVLWICGTNYLKDYEPADGSSYVFTKHMLPCGWASWGHKFERFYEGDLALWDDQYVRERISHQKVNQALLKQEMECWTRERRRIMSLGKANSWDYQMGFTLQAHGLLGIVPNYNQICNIGVDEHSIHGGTSFSNIMTSRFCGLPTKQLNFPLAHPKTVVGDIKFENLTEKIILFPLRYRVKGIFNKILKRLFFIPDEKSFISEIKQKFNFKWY
jgi:hypothetical protein